MHRPGIQKIHLLAFNETIKSYLAFNIFTVLYFKSKIHKDIKELNNSKEIFPII